MENCHTAPQAANPTASRIALVGNPNVGKSAIFHQLTGKYVIVSNYPGTTVEVASGAMRAEPDVVVVDTPGIVAFPPHSEDEAVTGRVLLEDHLRVVVQVGDAKNIRRTLHLTVQLAEMGQPLVLALNMMDEARARGLTLDASKIAAALNIPVVETVATRGTGLDVLAQKVKIAARPRINLVYPAVIENALNALEPLLPNSPVSPRALGLLWLSRDEVTQKWLLERLSPAEMGALEKVRVQAEAGQVGGCAAIIQRERDLFVEALARESLTQRSQTGPSLAIRIGQLTTHPVLGLPILALVLYGMYWFVGVFGASTLVGLLEENLFGEIINPWVVGLAGRMIPWAFPRELLFGEYGLWTMGITYAIALLLPIVVTFFITFGVLEDSGYLPRLAVLTNRIFTRMGLNGQAVLPMVLGLGCVTMATMTTRIMTSKRDRMLVTLLLALAVPCSAQLGVVMGMLAGVSLSAALIWGGLLLLVLFLVGWLAAKLAPGERAPLVVELPPLRFPVISNVLIKTAARLEWYIKEAVPLFLIGTLLLFLLDWFHMLPGLIKALEPLVVNWLGLPGEAASAFLLGLMRRDFAATGLFLMQSHGQLNAVQVVVSMVTITLFVPCIASMFMIFKERGWKQTTAMIAFIFPFAILVGGLLQRLLVWVGWNG